MKYLKLGSNFRMPVSTLGWEVDSSSLLCGYKLLANCLFTFVSVEQIRFLVDKWKFLKSRVSDGKPYPTLAIFINMNSTLANQTNMPATREAGSNMWEITMD
jgi:hypothetical protein